VPVISIATLDTLVAFLEAAPAADANAAFLPVIKAYRADYAATHGN
jgi:hypothetical protein